GPGDERDALGPGAELRVLLDAGVQVADDRAQLGDGLTVQREDQPEHPVGGRVLRAHVDDDVLLARTLGLVGGGRDDLVPVRPADVVDASLGGLGVSGVSGHSYALRSSGGGIVAPRY